MTEPSPEPARGNLNRFMQKVHEERGVDLSQYRPRYVERRVAVRLHHLGLHTYSQYAAFLDAHPDEYAKLMSTLTINVTQFFRDPSVYAVLRDTIVPEILNQKRERKQRLIRVWSAGCATGQEPYSLAMSFLDGMDRVKANPESILSVIGTDIDRDAIAVAKRAEYPIADLHHIPHHYRTKYVERGLETFTFSPEVMRTVRYQYLNLFADAPIHGIDVVFCRNVFIYFSREEQERMLAVFRSSLVRGGYLVLGRSERLATSLSKEFELVNARERVYRRPFSLL
ncbi:protein-glutamate O-methyltransferase CheR [bacterium]|nr:protein-glutamate O-methyltransferase CheR [bacterium]